jgi:hypothetical protein
MERAVPYMNLAYVLRMQGEAIAAVTTVVGLFVGAALEHLRQLSSRRHDDARRVTSARAEARLLAGELTDARHTLVQATHTERWWPSNPDRA